MPNRLDLDTINFTRYAPGKKKCDSRNPGIIVLSHLMFTAVSMTLTITAKSARPTSLYC
jgi:hypothetical protein